MRILILLLLGFGMLVSEVESGEVCNLCKSIVEYVYKFVAEGKTESEIIDALELICDILPKSDKDICDEIIEQYIPVIIIFVEHEATPEKVCETIFLCKKNDTMVVNDDSYDNYCAICEYVVKLVDKLMEDGKSEDEIEGILEKWCALLPGPYSDSCNKMCKQNLPSVIRMLKAGMSNEKICQYLNLCTSKR